MGVGEYKGALQDELSEKHRISVTEAHVEDPRRPRETKLRLGYRAPTWARVA